MSPAYYAGVPKSHNKYVQTSVRAVYTDAVHKLLLCNILVYSVGASDCFDCSGQNHAHVRGMVSMHTKMKLKKCIVGRPGCALDFSKTISSFKLYCMYFYVTGTDWRKKNEKGKESGTTWSAARGQGSVWSVQRNLQGKIVAGGEEEKKSGEEEMVRVNDPICCLLYLILISLGVFPPRFSTTIFAVASVIFNANFPYWKEIKVVSQ